MTAEDDLRMAGDVHDLRAAIMAVQTQITHEVDKMCLILNGANGNNGIKGDIAKLDIELKALDDDVQEAKAWGHKVWEVDRYRDGGCLGIVEVNKLKAEMKINEEQRKKEMIEMRKSRYAMLVGLGVAVVSTSGSIIETILKLGAKP